MGTSKPRAYGLQNNISESILLLLFFYSGKFDIFISVEGV